jgi:hypothetical protein
MVRGCPGGGSGNARGSFSARKLNFSDKAPHPRPPSPLGGDAQMLAATFSPRSPLPLPLRPYNSTFRRPNNYGEAAISPFKFVLSFHPRAETEAEAKHERAARTTGSGSLARAATLSSLITGRRAAHTRPTRFINRRHAVSSAFKRESLCVSLAWHRESASDSAVSSLPVTSSPGSSGGEVK